MDSSIFNALAVWVLALFTLVFVALAEISLAVAERLRLKQLVEADSPSLQAVEELQNYSERFASNLIVLRAGAYVVAASAAALGVWQLRPGIGPLAAALALTTLLMLVIQFSTWGIATHMPDQMALWIFGLLRLLAYALWPVTQLLEWLEQGFRGAAENVRQESLFLSEEHLHLLLRAGEERGVIEQEEKEMIASIFEFGETLVREVMVPRIDIVAIEVSTPLSEAVQVILDAGHSRIPVYRENIDNIIGLLYAKDLLRCFAEGKTDVDISTLLRPAYFIPESKKVDDLLQELQQRKVHMAIVVDEYGGTAGLVTIEDLLEEIVGEIQDEYDAEEPFIEEISETEFIFNARVDLDEVNRRLHVELPSEGGDTLGGFIYSQLGRVPKKGDTISFDSVVLEVLSVNGHRIERVRVRREVPSGEAAGQDAAAPVLISFFPFR